MADKRLYCCRHYQPGHPRVCSYCANGMVSQSGKGEGTSLPSDVEAVWKSYYASQQSQTAFSQAQSDLARMTRQPLHAGTIYRGKVIANSAVGTPGAGYPYPESISDDPAFALNARARDQRAPSRQQATDQRVYPAQISSSNQQLVQRRSISTQLPWVNREHQVHPRDGSSSGQYRQQNRQQPHHSGNQAYDNGEAEGNATDDEDSTDQ